MRPCAIGSRNFRTSPRLVIFSCEVTSVEDSDLMILSAREWGGFSWNNLELISGRMPHDATEEAVVLGQTAAEMLKKKVGDPIQIETKELKVVGIVKGGALVEDGSVILSLPLLQEIIGSPNQINAIDVRVTPGTTEQQLAELDATNTADLSRKFAP